jgi:hypothetical protein
MREANDLNCDPMRFSVHGVPAELVTVRLLHRNNHRVDSKSGQRWTVKSHFGGGHGTYYVLRNGDR